MPVQCTCLVCGHAFLKKPSEVRSGAGKHCSEACMRIGRRARGTLPCEACGAPVTKKLSLLLRGRVFCDNACFLKRPVADADTSRCSICKEAKPLAEFNRYPKNRSGVTSQCRSCLNAQTARYRRINGKRYHARDGEQYWAHHAASLLIARAHYAVKAAIKRGDLVRPTICEQCGKAARIEAAHRDYTLPLDVRWLCKSCHVLWDRAEPKSPHRARQKQN